MPTPEEVSIPGAKNRESLVEPKVPPRRRGPDASAVKADTDSAISDPADAIMEFFQGLRKAMDSPNFGKIIEMLAKRMDHDTPIREKELQFRSQVHERNTRFYATNRNYFVVSLTVCLVFLGWIMWLFQSRPDTLLPVLTAVIGLIAGAGGGYVFGQQRRDDSAK